MQEENESKRKRIRRKIKRRKSFSLKFLGNNVDGIMTKLEALEFVIISEEPSVIFLQETKVSRSGRTRTRLDLV